MANQNYTAGSSVHSSSTYNDSNSEKSIENDSQSLSDGESNTSGSRFKLTIVIGSQSPIDQDIYALENQTAPSDFFVVILDSIAVQNYISYYTTAEYLSVGLEYLDWKMDTCKYYSNPISALTKGHLLDLSQLGSGRYTFGGSLKCTKKVVRSQLGSPSCPDFIGEIFYNRSTNEKYIVIADGLWNAGREYELKYNCEIHLNDHLCLWVNDSDILYLFDTTKILYQNVQEAQEKMFLPFNYNLIYYAEALSEHQLKVFNFFEDSSVLFKIVHTLNVFHLYYSDYTSMKQKAYPLRVVDLHPVGSNRFIVNFNFSYPTYIPKRFKCAINRIDYEINAGLDPILF